MLTKLTRVAEATAPGIYDWLTLAPETAKRKFKPREAKATPETTGEVTGKKELLKYIENYPGTPAVLAIYKKPSLIKYYFPKLKISDANLEIAQEMVKMQIYADILKKTKDISLLDRIEQTTGQVLNLDFNTLQKNEQAGK